MKKINIDVAKHCPRLVELGENGLTINIDPETQVDGDSAPCFEGGQIVEATITSDAYVAKKTVAVELKCRGCTSFPEGFKKSLRERG